MGTILVSWLTWQGLFIGVEQSAPWQNVFRQPSVGVSALAIASVTPRIAIHGYVLQPVQGGSAIAEIGVSWRVF